MKRKVCESLFAVTLALTVAVTNIPVTAFATEINQSARQEQMTEKCTEQKIRDSSRIACRKIMGRRTKRILKMDKIVRIIRQVLNKILAKETIQQGQI